MQQVFVYGTLKRGFPNFAGKMDQFTFVGTATTVDAFPLVVGGPWRSPYLIDEPGTGHQVVGEVFEVDDDGLEVLDAFEGTHLPNGYRRTLISIACAWQPGRCEAWVFVKDRATIEGIHTAPMREYLMDASYIRPELRPRT